MDEREWYELRLTEEFQQAVLRENYPALRYVSLIGPRSARDNYLKYVQVKRFLECPICEDTCSLHKKEKCYVLYDSLWTDQRIDEDFLYMAVSL